MLLENLFVYLLIMRLLIPDVSISQHRENVNKSSGKVLRKVDVAIVHEYWIHFGT